MFDRRLAALVVFASLALAACGGGAATTAPSAAAPSDAPSIAPSAAGGACAPSTAVATVPVTIAGFAFPATITARVGDVVGFTNDDGAPHTATLDDGSCTTENLAKGATGSLVFSVAGSYPFHCKIHPNMTGTIEVAG
mgnify:CR=1 FL=1